VEIDCHGGIIAMQKILDAVIKCGARPAEPGEFTKRAFLNGRIDLSRAEAVADIISAKNRLALKNAVSQLRGSVRKSIIAIREDVINAVAFIEAAIDDPEHISAEGFGEELSKRVRKDIEEIDALLSSADEGRMIKEGVRTVIIGKPNVGKSSFLNALLGTERAIVTDIAGTTRDTLEEHITVAGVPLNIVDTAGIRESGDTVEKIGVERAREALLSADLNILILDASDTIDENDLEIIKLIKDKKSIVLLNKTDLDKKTDIRAAEEAAGCSVIGISAKEGTGLEAFKERLREMFFNGDIDLNDEVYITNERHKSCLLNAKESLGRVLSSIEAGMPEDFYSIDLMDAYGELGSIIGEQTDDDLIDTIFSNFCMGK
ncbi:MAG: tRNA uridine-5-carboxymethylaminomethyl(34) synthesis GTPase MnmE, partial [Lachnospiraceae bacterium]|nr:tRNA uridine-5-carboxymethylaminomethyl(34) synthesis GTPase MnmE [Lachnospiraceae bacterium]